MKNFTITGLFLTLIIGSCIPIEDLINPTVTEFELEQTYFYQDTIDFSVQFTDNTILDSGSLSISRANNAQGTNDWDTTIIFELQGRSFLKEFQIVVPEFVSPGRYQMNLLGTDVSDRPVEEVKLFNVQTDITNPVLNNILIDLPQNEAGEYLACRSDVVQIAGSASDNISINRVGFALSTGQRDEVAVSPADTVEIGSIFGSNITIPNNATDGAILTLTIFAADTFNNREAQDFTILVDCDDRPPEVTINRTTPQVNNLNRASVVQGTFFRMDSVTVADNRFVKEVTLFFNRQGQPLEERFKLEVNSGQAVNIASFEEVQSLLTFPVETDEVVGSIFEVTIIATDSVGNNSEPEVTQFTVIEDDPPLIVITNTYLDGAETPFEEVESTPIRVRQRATFDGKIEELNQLILLEMRWGVQGATEVVVSETEFDAATPISFANFQEEDTFEVRRDAEVGTVYELTVLAVDSKRQEATLTYLFEVVE